MMALRNLGILLHGWGRLYYLGLLRKPVERPESSSQGRSEMQCVCPDFDPENWGRSLNTVFILFYLFIYFCGGRISPCSLGAHSG